MSTTRVAGRQVGFLDDPNMLTARVAGYQVGFLDDPINRDMSLSIFFAGCPRRCPGCHNPELQSMSAGKEVTIEEIKEHISKTLEVAPIRGIVYLGGEPLLYLAVVNKISEFAKKKDLMNILYTGYTFEEIVRYGWLEYLDLIDVMIDGPYLEEFKTGGFPASSNQKVWVNISDSWVDATGLYKN